MVMGEEIEPPSGRSNPHRGDLTLALSLALALALVLSLTLSPTLSLTLTLGHGGDLPFDTAAHRARPAGSPSE